MNLNMMKDSSFNKSFERENGWSFMLFGQNKLFQSPSINLPNNFTKNGSFNLPTNAFVDK